MKKLRKVFAVLLAVIMTMQCSVTAFAATQTGSIFTSSIYTHQSQFDGFSIEQGIDVSYHNGTIDWAKVKQAGVDFAILRVGYRGYAAAGKVMPDNNFNKYIHDAYAQGLKLGIYFYSQALNTEESTAEAVYAIEKLQEAVQDIPGFKLELPIFYDYEFAETSAGRLDSAWANKTLNKTKMTNNAIAFCNTVKNAGYDAMVYSSKSFMSTQLNKTTITNAGYGLWLAHYTTNTDYVGTFKIWQFSSKGKVDGISGNVDSNFMYIDNNDTKIQPIVDQTYNGTELKPEPVVEFKGETLEKDKDYRVEYYNNVNIGTANVIIVFIGAYDYVPMKVVSFRIVPPAPTGLSLTARGTTSLDVCWNAVEGVSGYKVEVKRSTGWVLAGSTTNTYFTIKGLSTASNYQIRVRGYNNIMDEIYDGAYSQELQSATSPAKVNYISTSDRSLNSITLYWTKQTNASSYDIFIYNTETKKYELCKTVTGGKNYTAKITGLKANSSYKFKVQAIKNSKEGITLKGPKSDYYKAYTSPSVPKINSFTSPSKKKVRAKWSKVSGVTGYQVKWSKKSNFAETKTITYKGASTVTKTVSSPSKSGKYCYFKIRSYKTLDGGGKIYSSWSAVKKVKVK